ncbi:MAG TPA: FAD-binding and (Fe-S)-binding domain-containing protein [Longimicrobiales bacterium]|nr:FAD-binding and (Fe-S)-binding domain-containing protein [Longimicrobiales bacterium]
MATLTRSGDASLPGRSGEAARLEVPGLEQALRHEVRGEVRFDAGSRGMYSTDASSYRQVPIGVVLPLDDDDVRATVRVARRFGVPLLGRGGGTSLAGQCVNTAIVLDFSKHMGRVLEVNAAERWARVQPGTVLDDLQAAVREHGLTFGPDPATHSRCTLGGMIGNNSCGVHSVQAQHYGPGPRTEDQVLELRVLTYDGEEMVVGPTSEEELERIVAGGGRRGEIYRGLRELRDRYADEIRARFPDIPRRVSGYNLPSLLPEGGFDVAKALVGTESTCVIVLEAKVTLIPDPPERVLLIMGYDDIYHAADHVVEIMAHRPLGLEGMDIDLVEAMRLKGLHTEYLEFLPAGRGWLLVEFGGDTVEAAEGRARAAAAALEGSSEHLREMQVLVDEESQHRVWVVRESGLGATASVPGMPLTWEGWEDAAVAPAHCGDYLRDFRALMGRYGYRAALYGHFGQGCVHCRINFDYETRAGLDRYLAFIEEAADLVLRYGGSISGEHGDGQSRGSLLPKMFGEDLMEAFRDFKRLWDPDWKMNPGKVVDAYPPDSNLVLGVDWDPPEVETHFRFPEDRFAFQNATLRCVGVGLCRRKDGGTMCPSYMVTLEEKHSTRGRARLLYEMMRGETVRDGWKSEEVKDALDLCLACKGCKGDCPVDVDMATYKAEFLSHYYEGRLRPRSAYAMGLIYWWARLAQLAPGLVNRVMRAPGLSGVAKKIGGIAAERELPEFAAETFRDWFVRRGGSAIEGRRVLLWPDTFNNFFHPEVGAATVEVLEAAGFEPVIPQAMLCCGRPLYDHGMLTLGKRLLRQILDGLREEIRKGTPVVGMEPSCVSTLRDELINLFPHDADARRLAQQTFLLTEFLAARAPDADLGTLPGQKALVHGHCHHKAVLAFDTERAVLDRLGLDYEVLDSGCCGMAGSFGFDARHYDVSQACGERVLLPAIRAADPGTMVITDGFSCREMIEQNRLRRPLHMAEVIQMAMKRAGLLPEATRRARAPAAGKTPAFAPAVRMAWGAGAGLAVFRAGRALLGRR